MNYIPHEALTTAYLWASIIVWTTAVAQAVRFNDSTFILVMRAVFAVWPALCLAGMAAS